MKHLSLVIVSLLLVGAVGYSVSQWDDLRKLRADQAALEKERADLRQKLWDAQKSRQPVANTPEKKPAGDNTAQADDGTITFSVAEPGSSPGRDRRGGAAGRFGAMMNTPEMQQIMFIQQKAGLDARYARLFKQLNLSPADLEKFKGLLVDKQSAVMDVMMAAREQGLGGREGRDELRQLMQSTQAEVDGQIRSLLGEQGFAQFQNYEQTQPQRAVVGQLEQRLSYTSAPLTETQATQLTHILAQNSPRNERGGGDGVRAFTQSFVGNGSMAAQFIGAGQGGGTISDAAVAQAQGVLSAPQLGALRQLQQEQQAAAQLQRQMRDSFGRRANTGDAAQSPAPAQPPKG